MKAKYDRIGTNYNETRKADPYLFESMMQLLSPSKYETYLDIGCGTGNYTKEFAKRGYQFIGIDPSEEMLLNAKSSESNIDWRQGAAEKIDLEDESVDGALAILTLHHWENISEAFVELFRVLKAEGRFVIFTSLPDQMEGYWLRHYFPMMLKESTAQMPSMELIRKAMVDAGLEMVDHKKYFIQNNLEDLFLNSGKHKPEQYLDPKVRSGISSFAAVANKIELEEGLANLKLDIESGKINEVIDKYQNELGDYLFIVAKKP